MHSDIDKSQFSNDRQHSGIIFASRNVIYDEITDKVISTLHYIGPIGINRQPQTRELLPELLEDRFKAAPFLFWTYSIRTRA
jgi:hypothetical protein